MRFDWIGKNWYFLDSTYRRLFVCNEDFQICRKIFSGNVEKPKDLAIDPNVG